MLMIWERAWVSQLYQTKLILDNKKLYLFRTILLSLVFTLGYGVDIGRLTTVVSKHGRPQFFHQQ